MDAEKVRKDFPSLQQVLNGKPVIYLDNACMTLRPRQVIEAVKEYYEKYPSCAGRSVHKFGDKVTHGVEEVREKVSQFLGAKRPEEIVFTKNTTEGINLVANSLGLDKGDKVLTTDREHNSNLLPWQFLVERRGVEHKVIKSREDGTFDLERFEREMDGNVKLVSMVHSSNLDGYTTPMEEIVKIAQDYGALVLADGAQSAPHKKINLKKLGVDFFAFSGHKMLGPSGTGGLYARGELLEELEPFLVGGETVQYTTYKTHKLEKPPEKFEAGLQNYAGIIGLGAAVDYLEKIGRKNIEKQEKKLNKLATEAFQYSPSVDIIGPQEPEKRGGIFSFNVEGLEPHDVAIILDDTANIMVRSGQHCVHSWFSSRKIEGSVRASFYFYNTEREMEIFISKLKEIIKLG